MNEQEMPPGPLKVCRDNPRYFAIPDGEPVYLTGSHTWACLHERLMGELASTGYCLADPGQEYLVYLPEGGEVTVDLRAVKGMLQVEWFNPAVGETIALDAIDGGAHQAFQTPFDGHAVLLLKAS